LVPRRARQATEDNEELLVMYAKEATAAQLERIVRSFRRTREIDEAKIASEARYDGKWVLRTNTELPADDVALQYKRLWLVEHWFRSCKSLLETRPIYHKCDATIRGHVFCSFLALPRVWGWHLGLSQGQAWAMVATEPS